MAIISKSFKIQWSVTTTILTERDLNLLFEIFGPFPVRNEFTVRSGLIGLGKSRIMIANQDQLRDIIWNYIEELSLTQQRRLKELIHEWEKVSIKIVKFDTAERVKFRVSAPEEERKIILKRIQTYIPIYRIDEVPEDLGGTGFDTSGNQIGRG